MLKNASKNSKLKWLKHGQYRKKLPERWSSMGFNNTFPHWHVCLIKQLPGIVFWEGHFTCPKVFSVLLWARLCFQTPCLLMAAVIFLKSYARCCGRIVLCCVVLCCPASPFFRVLIRGSVEETDRIDSLHASKGDGHYVVTRVVARPRQEWPQKFTCWKSLTWSECDVPINCLR